MDGSTRTSWCLALLAAGTLSLQSAAGQHTPASSAAPAHAVAHGLTDEAGALYHWIRQANDNHGLPFMIIDKKQAHLWVYDRAGRLQGDAPVLLGSSHGDHTLPGIGSMKLSQIRPEDLTTPAGRFVAERGVNERGEQVVWIDYDAAVSMHPVLTSNPRERRQQRLDTPTPADNHISHGCVNVPTAFHANVVLGTVKQGRSVVYILPETKSLHAVFPQLDRVPVARR